MFTGLLVYADDIALLAPVANAMWRMLSVCETSAYHLMLPNRNVLSARFVVCLRNWNPGRNLPGHNPLSKTAGPPRTKSPLCPAYHTVITNCIKY